METKMTTATFKMTPGQMKVLKFMVDHEEKTGHRGAFPPGYIGQDIWGNMRTQRQPQAYARTSGKILNALKTHGLVTIVMEGRFPRWQITSTGERLYREALKKSG